MARGVGGGEWRVASDTAILQKDPDRPFCIRETMT